MSKRRCLNRTTLLAFSMAWLLARAAFAGPLVLEVRPSLVGDASAARPLVLARADAALRLARRDYTGSHFESCVQRLQRAEENLAGALRETSDWLLLKRVNLWLGLCLAVSGQADAARPVFRRGERLPGPPLDAAVAPPAVLRLSREAGRGSRCPLASPAAASELTVDGAPLRAGALTEQGEHYAAWRAGDGALRSGRVTIDESCRLNLPGAPRMPAARSFRIDPVEAADPTFLRQVAIAAGVRDIWLRHSSGRVQVFDLLSGTLEERSGTAADVLVPTSSMPAQVATRPTPRPTNPTRPTRGTRPRWYKHWLLWTMIGAVTAAAIIIPVVEATRPPRYKVTFEPTP